MIQIIPAIIAKDFQEFQDKINKVEPYLEWAQLDIMDGKFVNNSTWNKPEELRNINTNLNLEAHLMVNNPEEAISDWINSGVKRIIFHYEATDKHREIIEKIKKSRIEVGIALNPETPINVLDDFIKELDLVLVMTVNPGFGGQGFLNESVDKVKELREEYKNVKIEVDGGINLKTAPKVIKAGANIFSCRHSYF